jgi:UDP-N-acetyl-2-amino-2-deoxyglucuronate dehydrogenase
VNIGLIGAGNISDTHARAARAAGLRIAGVFGENRDKARQLADRHGATAYDTLDALLADPGLDFVIIGSPSGCHADHATAAVRARRHVLVEKPLDITTARIDALADEVTGARATLGVIFQDRLKPGVMAMKRRLDAGELGTPLIATAEVKWFRSREYYSSSRWRGTWALDGGGALMNQGIHTVDLLLHLLGPVARVTGLTATRHHAIEAEDTATALLEFANGAQGTLDVTTAAYPGSPRRLRIAGTAGSLWLEGDRLMITDAPGSDPIENASSPVVSDVTAHQCIIEDFVAAIRDGRAPVCDVNDGRLSVEVVEAVYRSARDERAITLEPRNR